MRKQVSKKEEGFASDFALICAAVAGGGMLRDACAAVGIKQWRFQEIVLSDPLLRGKWMAAKDRCKKGRLAAGHLRHADEILTQLEAGRSLRTICAGDPRFPKRQTFVAALKYSPDLELRYDLALTTARSDPFPGSASYRPHAKALAAFEEIERRIIAGGAIIQILNSDRSHFPHYSNFVKMLKAHQELDARYRAAGRARQAGPNALRQGPAYSASELRQGATTLMLSNARNEIHTSRLSPGGIHTQTLLRARFRNPDLLVAVESAVATRRTRLRLVNGRPKIDPANVRLIAPAPKILRPDTNARLASALGQNDIWRLAAAALPKTLDRDTRDDVIADIVMEVLEGKLAPNLIGKRAGEFLRAHNKRFSTFTTRSLDAPLVSDSAFSLIDTVSTGWD